MLHGRFFQKEPPGRRRQDLKPDAGKVYIFGASQSGGFITHMIYQGFHVDEAGRMVIAGARIHVGGAGKGGFNHRFGLNTNISEHLELNYMPGDFFPFNYAPQEGPLTGQKGDVLAVAKKLGKIPYIMVTNNEAEYWTRFASLLHTDVLGKKAAPVHKKVRIYFAAGTGHYASGTRERGICEHSLNVIDHYPISRALLKALDRWVTDGVTPPPSTYPRIDRNELITPAQHKKQFPEIPGMRHPGKNLQPPRVNYGDKFRQEGIITVIPPEMGEPYISLSENSKKKKTLKFDAEQAEKWHYKYTRERGNEGTRERGGLPPCLFSDNLIKVDPKIYDAYVGQYEIEPGATIKILKENNGLFAKLGEQPKIELFPESETKYFIKEAPVRLTFIKDDRGAVIQLLVHTDRGDMRAKKIK